jgi:urea transporter
MRDVALREIAQLPLTQKEWEGLAVLAAGLVAARGTIEALRLVLSQVIGGDE